MPGVEVALEGLLRDGALEVLAVFDKPDPLEGPYFEETIYVTPSRLPAATLATCVARGRARARRAIGLTEGPVHAEVRIARGPRLGDRGRGALDRRALRAHAAVRRGHQPGGGDPPPRARAPARRARPRDRRGGRDDAADRAGRDARGGARPRRRARGRRASSGSRSRSRPGATVVPLPDGDRYLGFLFARARHPGGGRGRAAGSGRRTSIWSSRERPPGLDLRARPPAARGRGPGRRPAGPGPRRALPRPVGRALGSGARRRGPTRSRSRCRCTPRPGSPARSRPTDRRPGRVLTGSTPAMCADVADRARSAATRTTRSLRWIEDDRDLDAALDVLPARDLLPPLERYAHARASAGEEQLVASVEASRGLRAPVPPLPGAGRLRRPHPDQRRRRGASPTSRQQVALGARHVTYGDPDFFNGVHHALRVVRAVHARFPDLTFDCTVKVEHILRHAGRLGRARRRRAASSSCPRSSRVNDDDRSSASTRATPRPTPAQRGRAPARARHRGPAVVAAVHAVGARSTTCARSSSSSPTHDLVGERRPGAVHDPAARARGLAAARPHRRPRPVGRGPAHLPVDVTARPAAGTARRARRSRRPTRRSRRSTTRCGSRSGSRRSGSTDRRATSPRLDEPWFCCAEPTELQLRAL